MTRYYYTITHYNQNMVNQNIYASTCHYVFDCKEEAYDTFRILCCVPGTKSVKLWKDTPNNGASQILENYINHEGE